MTYTKEQVLAIIGQDEEAWYKDGESWEKREGWIERNDLRTEQRKRLEKIKPKKTREVIQYC